MSAPQAKQGILSINQYVAGKSASKPSTKPIKLSSNENPYGPSPKAIEAYHNTTNNINRYPNAGCSGVRQAIADVHGLNADNLMCGAGSDELLGMLVHAFAGAGDEVLYPEHGFLMYKIYTLGCGATPVEAKETKLTTDVDALLSAVTEKTKIVFVANPNNPTGSYISGAELKRLRDGLPEHVILAIDAAYAEYAEHLADEDYSAGQELAETTNNTVMLRTFSKIYGLPAVRLGWMLAPDNIIDILGRIRSPFNVTSAAQAAGEAAVRDTAWVSDQQQKNADGLAFLERGLHALGIQTYPSVGNFVLAECGTEEKAKAILKKLAEANIFVRDVIAYKLPSCLRISVGTKPENKALLATLEASA